jgi:hypothetical protein
MAYTNESGRRQILDDTADAATSLALAIAILGEAYEHLDDQSAERMEDWLFRPVQAAYGLLKRTRTEFADRYGLVAGDVGAPSAGLPADPRLLVERAGDAAQAADEALAELQDTLLPVEVGDQPLRAALARVRTLIAPVPGQSAEFIRGFGR